MNSRTFRTFRKIWRHAFLLGEESPGLFELAVSFIEDGLLSAFQHCCGRLRVIKVIDGQLIGIIDGQSGARGFAGA